MPLLVLLLCLGAVSTAAAQSAYVGGAVIADVVRASGPTNDNATGSGEAIGGALRVGVPLGASFGVDLEFTRSGDIDGRPDAVILAEVNPVPAIFPQPEIRFRQQLTTVVASVWFRQDVSERLDILYLGGAAFSRRASEIGVNYPALPFALGPISTFPRLYESESVSYGAGVSVGLDTRVAMTEHLRLVPGLRLLTVSPGGWVLRPAVGLHWQF